MAGIRKKSKGAYAGLNSHLYMYVYSHFNNLVSLCLRVQHVGQRSYECAEAGGMVFAQRI